MPESDARERADLIFEVWNRDGLEAMAERFWHPEIVWSESRRFPDARTHHGREAVMERMAERFAALGRIQIEVVDAQDHGETTLVEAIVRGRGSASGAPTEMREFFLVEIEAGLTTRFAEFLDRDDAVAAARGDRRLSPDR